MFKMKSLIKKIALAALVLVIGLTAYPISGASAAGMNGQANPQPDNSRLENLWASEQSRYKLQGDRISNAGDFIAWVQTLINRANAKGWDTSSVQAALNALSAVIPAVQAAHAPGSAILASHTGFNANGKVTDRITAIATAESLARVLKNTRTAMNGTGMALLAAIRVFRDAHPRSTTIPVR